MRRMYLERPVASTGEAVRLAASDRLEIEDFLKEGEWVLFLPNSLASGHYYGIRENGRLIAIAGTHVASSRYDIAALGTVFTHPGHRGRGLAHSVPAMSSRASGAPESAVSYSTWKRRKSPPAVSMNAWDFRQPVLTWTGNACESEIAPWVKRHSGGARGFHDEAAYRSGKTEQERREDKYIDERVLGVWRKVVPVLWQDLHVCQELFVKGNRTWRRHASEVGNPL